LIALVALAFAAPAGAYPVGPALTLEELIKQADVIVKAKAVSARPIEDVWFTEYRGYVVFATEMKVVSVLKGDLKEADLAFHHYGYDPNHRDGYEFLPQLYKFEPGRSYILFAKRTESPGILRQLWKHHKTREDQGVILAADDKPSPKGRSIKDVLWAELTGLLASSTSADVRYGIRQLNQMSGGGLWGTKDFDRENVAAAIIKLIRHKDAPVADEAIRAIGAKSPYVDDGEAAFWLCTIGKGSISGLTRRDANVVNRAAGKFWKEIVALIDGDAAAKSRALAIRALGRSGVKEIDKPLGRWTKDADAQVRQAAAILLADFPIERAAEPLTRLSNDKDPRVRLGVARAVGFGQFARLLPLLDRMLEDKDAKVRTAAALSLLSFDPKLSKDVLLAHRKDADFKSVFINALAVGDAGAYLDDLVEIIQKRLEPRDFWGGLMPWCVSWEILFEYVGRHTGEQLQSGKLDKYLDALERAHTLNVRNFRNSLLELSERNGLAQRARRIRQK